MTKKTTTLSLSEEQYDILLDARGLDDPEVVESADLAAAKEALAWAVSESRQISLESAEELPLSVLSNQIHTDVESDDVGVAEALREAAQVPETGSADAEDRLEACADDEDDTDGLSADEIREIQDNWESAELLRDRCPDHVSNCEAEIMSIADTNSVSDALEAAGIDAE